MRSLPLRIGIALCALPAIAVVGASAAQGPDGDAALGETTAAEVDEEELAPTNAAPPNPDPVTRTAARGDAEPAPEDAGDDERAGSQPDAGNDERAEAGAEADGGDGGSRAGAEAGEGAERAGRSGGTRATAGNGGRQAAGPADGDVGGKRPARRDAAPGPNATWQDAPAPDPSSCPQAPRAVVVDRQWQRAWLCDEGQIATVIPVTTARDQPDPGDYPVYAKDWQSFSDTTDERSWLDRFIAFTRGENEGLRIGFHAVPYYEDGTRLQPFESVGSQQRFGDSAGCIRVLPDHAELLWGYLREDDVVRVLT